jgi:hypothetical protein
LDYSARARGHDHLIKAAYAAAVHAAEPHAARSPVARARSLYPNDDTVVSLLTRTTRPPADTTTTGWATELSNAVVSDFVASLAPLSGASQLISAGSLVSLDGIDTLAFPRRSGLPSNAVAWVAEGAPHAVKNYALTASTLGPTHKLAIGAALTREAVTFADGEKVVRQLLREDAAASLDAAVFGTAAADTTRPAGLLNGVTPITATTGGGEAAMLGDFEKLAKAIAVGGGNEVTFFAGLAQATSARLRLGRDRAVNIWPTTGLAAGTIVAVDPNAFASAFGPEPRIEASKEATVHFEDTAPLNITTAAVAATVRSAWQMDLVVLRLTLYASWIMRAPDLVQVINSATW